MDQELKSEGQGHKIYIFKNGEDQKINNTDIENTVFSIDSKVSKNAKVRDRYNQKPHLYPKVNVKVTKYLFSKLEKNRDF